MLTALLLTFFLCANRCIIIRERINLVHAHAAFSPMACLPFLKAVHCCTLHVAETKFVNFVAIKRKRDNRS